MIPKYTTWRKFLNEILIQLLAYVENYPPHEKKVLKDFLSVLQHDDVNTKTKRKALSERFEEYRNRNLETHEYYILPFLWFSVDYFWNANIDLITTDFHATSFYEYLVKQLRGHSGTKGAYQLIRDNITLSDLRWENLQYNSTRLTTPLTIKQFQAIKSVYTLISNEGIEALNSSRIRAVIMTQVKSRNFILNLSNWFKMLGTRWRLRFFTPAFGLENLFFHFQLENDASISEIIDFQDPRNLTLGTSHIYKIRTQTNDNNKFLGVLLIPTHQVEKIKTLFQSFASQGKLCIHELTQIKNNQMSTSLFLYQPKKGWRDITRKELNELFQLLKTKTDNEASIAQTAEFPFYITPLYNRQWNYLQHPQVNQAISLYCKTREFNYKRFPFDYENNNYTNRDQNLLKWFYHHNVLQVSWELDRLINDFSKEYYVIKLPTIALHQLLEFLKYVPFSQIFYTKHHIYLLTILNENLVNWIKNLKWTVIPILIYHYPLRIDSTWFDSELHQWKSPHILTV